MTVRTLSTRCRALGRDALLLLARITPGALFWQSGRTKVEGWQLKESTLYLFQEEYRLPLIDPALAAGLAAFAEHLLPILLLLGLGTRLAAAGLLGMTLVIQLLVYPDAWPTHGTWAVALLLLIGQGGGRLALDHGLQRLWRRRQCVSQNPCAGHADPEQCLRAPQ
ncbi:Putative oxidoreductase [Pseudomonas sp. 8BK]|uniref:DoxX family membrane protein n=1 Tax=Pseudomonas sp. 8BK TaxID=2653164 RepID=UPI0012F3382C|nr:DoxX family membrane protein [Pseudomonas sp. 8BK]VXB39900.1 Putative oxidoreductase [Pseudomonas sp. 8BK]